MEHSIGNTIRRLREEKDWTQAEFAKQLGLSDKAVSTWENDIKTPRMPTLKKIAALFSVDVAYIIGEKRDEPHSSVKIPVLGGVAAGIPITAIEEYIDPDDPSTWEEIPYEIAKNGTYFALRIEGDSMEPKISYGDTVIVRKQDDVENGDIAIVTVGGEDTRATCKKIKKRTDGILLMSTNPKYEPMYYNKKEVSELPVSILGKVIELRAKF